MNTRKLMLAVSTALVTAAGLPALAQADAKLAPPPIYSSVSGLPDGRVYEQASPFNKYGYGILNTGSWVPAGGASADGEAVWYFGDGPLTEPVGVGSFAGVFVAQRSSGGGWKSHAVLSRPVGSGRFSSNIFADLPTSLLSSSDLSHFAYGIGAAEVGPPDSTRNPGNLYLAGPDPLVEPAWMARPQVETSKSEPEYAAGMPIGGTPDLSTVYFVYNGNLLAQDSERLVHHTYGIYQYREGVLSEAGLMPDGTINPFGARPAARAEGAKEPRIPPPTIPDAENNEVAADGTRLFFVSPEPSRSKLKCQLEAGECSTEASELYARISAPGGAPKTMLVSQSQVPGHVGEPAPDGALAVKGTAQEAAEFADPASYVYASPDGSHAFFQSIDRLTSDAPSDTDPKVYDFDLDSGSLKYMAGVTGIVVGVASDGSSLLFEKTSTSPFELDRWSNGTVGKVSDLPQPPPPGGTRAACEDPVDIAGTVVPAQEPICVGPVRFSADGSTAVFATQSPIAGFNDPGGFFQVFRYDSDTDELSCLSCPPAGVLPTGDAVMSNLDYAGYAGIGSTTPIDPIVPDRAVSSDANTVFFQTPDPLVAGDTNGLPDVYEWQNGGVFLLASGQSDEPTYLIDSSESGNDVFLATSAELVKGDNDGSYDIYDARVPRPGDNPPPSALPCQGDVCQGPPSVPNLLGVPSSAAFNGLGNIDARSEGTPSKKAAPKKKSKQAKKKKKKLKKPKKLKQSKKSKKSKRRGA